MYFGIKKSKNRFILPRLFEGIHKNIEGNTINPLAFGNFKSIDTDEVTGILITSNFDKLTFPKPLKIEKKKITGLNYEIMLNENWTVRTLNRKGDLMIEFKK